MNPSKRACFRSTMKPFRFRKGRGAPTTDSKNIVYNPSTIKDDSSHPDFNENNTDFGEEFKTTQKPFNYAQQRSMFNKNDSSGLRDLKQVAFKPFREFESIQESKYIKMSNYEFAKFQESTKFLNSLLDRELNHIQTSKPKTEVTHRPIPVPEEISDSSISEKWMSECDNKIDHNKNKGTFSMQQMKRAGARRKLWIKSKGVPPNADSSIGIERSTRLDPKELQ